MQQGPFASTWAKVWSPEAAEAWHACVTRKQQTDFIMQSMSQEGREWHFDHKAPVVQDWLGTHVVRFNVALCLKGSTKPLKHSLTHRVQSSRLWSGLENASKLLLYLSYFEWTGLLWKMCLRISLPILPLSNITLVHCSCVRGWWNNK